MELLKWLFGRLYPDHVHLWEKKREWYDMYVMKCCKCGREKWVDKGY